MERRIVAAELREYAHPIFAPMRAINFMATNDVVAMEPLRETCRTPVGEPLCACGLFILEWDARFRYGRSQATDGAN